ncbi:hypothetical protein NFI96_002589 [Prochilodus magdalenae]|nr:hypothetical protein NFI96_002589 [Prochilodus magdalenae]
MPPPSLHRSTIHTPNCPSTILTPHHRSIIHTTQNHSTLLTLHLHYTIHTPHHPTIHYPHSTPPLHHSHSTPPHNSLSPQHAPTTPPPLHYPHSTPPLHHPHYTKPLHPSHSTPPLHHPYSTPPHPTVLTPHQVPTILTPRHCSTTLTPHHSPTIHTKQNHSTILTLHHQYTIHTRQHQPSSSLHTTHPPLSLHITTPPSPLTKFVSNCSEVIPMLSKYYLSPLYAVEFAIGFPFNLLVVLGYVFCLPSWKSTNVYMFNLALSDLIFLCTLPHLSYNYAQDVAKFIPGICVTNRYILHVNMYSSILFMVWVSVDRLLVVRYPLRDHVLLTCKGSLCVSLLTWIWINIQVAPLIDFLIKDLRISEWAECRDFGSLSEAKGTLIYSLVLTVTGYVLPLLALFLSSLKMVSLLLSQEQVCGTSFQKPLMIVRAATIMFLVLYTPVHVMRNVRIASQLWELPQCSKVYIQVVYIVTRPVAFAHSVINPIFYFLMTDRCRKKICLEERLSRWLGNMVSDDCVCVYALCTCVVHLGQCSAGVSGAIQLFL